MVNSLQKLGLSSLASGESRILSIDILQVMFEWEQSASQGSRRNFYSRDGRSKQACSRMDDPTAIP